MENQFRLLGRRWPLVERGGRSRGYESELEPPNTPEEIAQWQQGPKVYCWNESLTFHGFHVWVKVTEKDNPDLHKEKTEDFKPIGVVEEILSPNKAKFSAAGVLKIQIRVQEAWDQVTPLTPDDRRQVYDILDVLEGRRDAAQPAVDTLGAVLDEIRKANNNVDIALRKKEEAEAWARDAQEHPMDATRDMFIQFRGTLTPRQSALYDALKETGGKQAQAGNRLHPPMSQKAVWFCIHDVLRPAIRRAKLTMPTWLLTREERRYMRGAVNPPTRTPRGEIAPCAADEADGEE